MKDTGVPLGLSLCIGFLLLSLYIFEFVLPPRPLLVLRSVALHDGAGCLGLPGYWLMMCMRRIEARCLCFTKVRGCSSAGASGAQRLRQRRGVLAGAGHWAAASITSPLAVLCVAIAQLLCV